MNLESINGKVYFEGAKGIPSQNRNFCFGREYASIAKMHQKFDKATALEGPKLNVSAINDNFKGRNSSIYHRNNIGNISLSELKQDFKEDPSAIKQLLGKDEQKPTNEVSSRFENFIKEQPLLKLKSEKNRQEISELTKRLEDKKEKELQAKIEKEKIKAEFQAISQTNLKYHEEEKKRELERLAIERESLRKNEKELLKDMNGLPLKIQNREGASVMEREELWKKKGNVNNEDMKEEIRKREINIFNERGVRVAEQKMNRELLEFEKGKTMDSMNFAKKGNEENIIKLRATPGLSIPHATNGIPNILPETHSKLSHNPSRLAEIKVSIDQKRQAIPPETEEFNSNKDHFKKKWLKEGVSFTEEMPRNYPKKVTFRVGPVISPINFVSSPVLLNNLSINREAQRENSKPAFAVHSRSPEEKRLKDRDLSKPLSILKLGISMNNALPQHEAIYSTPTTPRQTPLLPMSYQHTPKYPLQIPSYPQINFGSYIPSMHPGTVYKPMPQASAALPKIHKYVSQAKEQVGKSEEKNIQFSSEMQKSKEAQINPRSILHNSQSTGTIQPLASIADRSFSQNRKGSENLMAEKNAVTSLTAQKHDSAHHITIVGYASYLIK